MRVYTLNTITIIYLQSLGTVRVDRNNVTTVIYYSGQYKEKQLASYISYFLSIPYKSIQKCLKDLKF